jgi:hypothetical protein
MMSIIAMIAAPGMLMGRQMGTGGDCNVRYHDPGKQRGFPGDLAS